MALREAKILTPQFQKGYWSSKIIQMTLPFRIVEKFEMFWEEDRNLGRGNERNVSGKIRRHSLLFRQIKTLELRTFYNNYKKRISKREAKSETVPGKWSQFQKTEDEHELGWYDKIDQLSLIEVVGVYLSCSTFCCKANATA